MVEVVLIGQGQGDISDVIDEKRLMRLEAGMLLL